MRSAWSLESGASAEDSARYFLRILKADVNLSQIRDAIVFVAAASARVPVAAIVEIVRHLAHDPRVSLEAGHAHVLLKRVVLWAGAAVDDDTCRAVDEMLARWPAPLQSAALRKGLRRESGPYWNLRVVGEPSHGGAMLVQARAWSRDSYFGEFFVDSSCVWCGVDMRDFADRGPVHLCAWGRVDAAPEELVLSPLRRARLLSTIGSSARAVEQWLQALCEREWRGGEDLPLDVAGARDALAALDRTGDAFLGHAYWAERARESLTSSELARVMEQLGDRSAKP